MFDDVNILDKLILQCSSRRATPPVNLVTISLRPNEFCDSLPTAGTIYQPLRSGRIWHKVNF